MKFAYDFHIHTALSPCGSLDMTPNNIVNMSLIKELDMIAVTDHNICGNAAAVMNVAKDTPLTVLPGMEVETREEIHTVCLFSSLEKVNCLADIVSCKLPSIANRKDIFGEQLLLNEFDEVIGEYDKLLLTACDLSIYDLVKMVSELGGVAIPAHVDRSSYSIISNLGFIPKDLKINCIEFSKLVDPLIYLEQNTYLKKYKYLQSSDAHYIEDILERQNFLDIADNNAQTIINYLTENNSWLLN